jgi:hypothetical protein
VTSDSSEGPVVIGYPEEEFAELSVKVALAVKENEDCFLKQVPPSASHDAN